MRLATAAQMREMDRRAIEEEGIPALALMEHAARAVADTVTGLAFTTVDRVLDYIKKNSF